MAKSDLKKMIEKIVGKEKEKVEEKKEEIRAEKVSQREAGKIYLKALSLHSFDDLEKIKSEIKSGNIVIVKITPLLEKNVEDAKRAISELSEFIESMGGDIARLGEERIVLTPQNIQIWKEKAASSETSTV
ncbi:MAG: cell division protein SepF [Candidatus Bathyarchaeota archaeon]|nr:cell division protein SepF [Candidatus Bathyarchaeota archaeon]